MIVVGFFLAAFVIGAIMGVVYERRQLRRAHAEQQRQVREGLQYVRSVYGSGDFEGGRGPHDVGVETPAAWTEKKEPDDEAS